MTDPDLGIREVDELEPVLPLDDVQGNVLPGFNKRHQQLVGLRIVDLGGTKRWISALAPEITTASEVVHFKELRRALKARRDGGTTGLASAWLSIAFSAPALRRLVSPDDVDLFEDDAFKVGLAASASAIGDPPPGTQIPGSPSWWEAGGSEGTTPDVLLVLAADVPEMLTFHRKRVDDLVAAAGPSVEVFFEQNGDDLPGPLRSHEHFGFRDGISQPGVRGRLPWSPNEFFTPRFLAGEDPDAGLIAKPGQPLVRVGQFLFGYATQDRLVPEYPAPAREAPPWAVNGSFLVFRRLEQDVAAFRSFIAAKTAELTSQPELKELTEGHFAALLVGRWPSGAPLSRTGTSDDPALAQGDITPNAFEFAEASRVYTLREGHEDPFPPAPADLSGLRCPIWAHVRKVNPRDITTEQGSDTDTLRRRILRRGIPFGDPFDHGDAGSARGLLFVSYQTSITDQFQFLVSSWMNTTDKPQEDEKGDGHDMLVGQNPTRNQERVRTARLRIPAGGARSYPFSTGEGEQWVFASGGGYFFAPSLSALTGVIATGESRTDAGIGGNGRP